ncbi:MAG: amino acid adenylation domain-containing protein, partial [Ferruginibacter sp.]
GYLNNAALTKEKFIANPSGNEDTSVMYGTGDLVKYLPDGNIEFIGRIDGQVKIRGYRVEPGEIESVLRQCALVSQAVVLATEDKQGNQRLTAYVVPDGYFDRDEIQAYLQEKLPDYMVPSLLVELEELPLTANGKIDRKALPHPEADELLSGQYVAPRNETESRLAAIWQDVLEVEQVGMHDDFFELGGHSLLAVRLVSAIRKAFTVEMPIGDIFDYPTVALLAAQLPNQSGAAVLPPIEKVAPRPELIPLSFSQERLWFIDQLAGSVQYHVPAVLRLQGKLDTEAFAAALKSTVNRHEVLRTVYYQQDGHPYQTIKHSDNWQLTFVDRQSFINNEEGLKEYTQQLINAPYNLSTDFMLRATLIRLAEDDHVLAITLHHIASDGWSRSILVNDFAAFYHAYEKGHPAKLPVLPVQYADYTLWQRNNLQGELLETKIDYWKQHLSGVSPLQLPTDFQRPAIQSTRGAITTFNIDKALAEELQTLSRQQGTTLFMTLLAAFKILLYRYSGQQDICVGTPIAGRQQQELEGLIGFFVNTLALRTALNGDDSFVELLQQVRTNTLAAYGHQEAPFEKVVEAVVKERDMSRSPIFQVMFVLRNTPEVPELVLEGINLRGALYEHTTALFDMTFFITETAEGFNCAIEYSTDLFSKATVNRMSAHFEQLLHSVVRFPQQKIGELTMLTNAEEHQLLEEFNATKVEYSEDRNIVKLFEEQAALTPHNIALVFEEEVFTYQQLNEKVNRLADFLQQQYHLKPDETIGVMMPRSSWTVVAMLAVIKTGVCYLPIDRKLPINRLQYIVRDSMPRLVLGNDDIVSEYGPLLSAPFVSINSIPLEEYSAINAEVDINLDSLSFVIYTSGSTGMPKGVMQTHRMMYNLITWNNDYSELGTGMKLLQYASFAFDMSLMEVYFSLSNGGTVFMLNEKIRLDFNSLANYICHHKIEIISVPFSALSSFFNTVDLSMLKGHSIHHIISAGEQLNIISRLQEFLQLYPHITLHNFYGPSETHVVTASRFAGGQPLPQRIHIGKPISNSTIYILDKYHHLVPISVTGEVFIGGDNLARGYLKNEILTNEKFIPHFFNKGEILYKAGDMGRWLPDGNIEYLGRMDDQIKIRGYRVELGEIENMLKTCVLVSEAVVVAKDDSQGNKQLVGYVLAEGEFDREGIIAFLKTRLPDYMIPALWVELANLPLTLNGKVDKRALPDPDTSQLQLKAYEAPGNDTEASLAAIWEELLRINKIGIHDNFFALGGHSLMAVKMISIIKKKFNLSIPIPVIFQFPTIHELADYLDWENENENEEEEDNDSDNDNTTTLRL